MADRSAARSRPQAGVLCRKLTDSRPIELFFALGDQPMETVVQQVGYRHRHVQGLRSFEKQTHVLVTERHCEARGLEFTLREQRTIRAVYRGRKQRCGEQFHEIPGIDAGLADEGECLPERLYGSSDHEVAGELDETRLLRLG